MRDYRPDTESGEAGATIRSREISVCLVLQAKFQLKAIYKDNADTIVGNLDSQIFRPGREPTMLKDLNQALGKEPIDIYNTGESRAESSPTLSTIKNWVTISYL